MNGGVILLAPAGEYPSVNGEVILWHQRGNTQLIRGMAVDTHR